MTTRRSHLLKGLNRRLYALERMAQVLHFNMHRIYDLWGIFLSHVLEVLASPKVSSSAVVSF